MAASTGHVNCGKTLITGGADVNSINKHYSIAGADVNSINKQ